MSIIDWKSGGRERSWRALTENTHWDIVIAGGGVTGAGVAREAARRGLRVLLVDRQDFSWGTSSRSSKMVHGGLRYIAQGDVRTTLHSVKERERLMQEAPGLVDLMPYMMPHYEGRFPGRFAFGMLLKVYDLLARRKYHTFHGAAAIRERYPFINPEGLAGASEFADAVTDDSRLVMRILHEARRDGAEVINYVAVDGTEQNADSVTVTLRDTIGGASCKVSASVLVNATGVWVNELREQLGQSADVRPARGSHIVIPAERLPVDVSFTILHPEDQRPIFVYPWEGRTVIGTTDLDHPKPDNGEVGITRREMDYLLALAAFQFPAAGIQEQDVISSWAGVRPLVASGAKNSSKESRDHTVWKDGRVVSVSGGKLTTFRLIALDVLKEARDELPEYDVDKKAPVFSKTETSVASLAGEEMAHRLAGFYGQDAAEIIRTAKAHGGAADLQCIPGTHACWAELRWQAASEAVVHLDDLLLRRNRLGLLLKNGGLDLLPELKERLQPMLGWSDEHWAAEVERYRRLWTQYYSLPSAQSEQAANLSEAEIA
ncbi:MAG: glycerol-3-phosphate dehydrogenase/oxidase [Thalassolituus sp.]|jgi:glycerol-3-phosphate dehydrogenase|uniref:glycerol-3-phosphate dehydrogenase/oxidase n=1 Tax=Thalassolituus sp. TaxID=2030822 RepID=UPI0027D54AB5|nr:glycerol-3-phosphate dehydrogenase/oxidase [Thalassolituus sp.]MDQ4423757.1 glycerol-3-phosphate dehydrogenase/oxidase [Thalassolituus sp.]MDQ4424865.1 glycerol-3-phosphate dehydrogenase/oxidase [Thalassolituus sp.]|tara:strand:+ start:119 stop:1756 length:1638 start_codon:yes stop_codon:yes gene_type:complete